MVEITNTNTNINMYLILTLTLATSNTLILILKWVASENDTTFEQYKMNETVF